MYDLIDRPVATLGAFDRGILDRMRRWVHALTLAGPAAAPEPSGNAFDDAMRTLDRGSTETLVFQRPCHSTVEETEAVVIGLWRLIRDDRIGAANGAAMALVSAEFARPMVAAMIRAVAAQHD
jgi:hypothetical protein